MLSNSSPGVEPTTPFSTPWRRLSFPLGWLPGGSDKRLAWLPPLLGCPGLAAPPAPTCPPALVQPLLGRKPSRPDSLEGQPEGVGRLQPSLGPRRLQVWQAAGAAPGVPEGLPLWPRGAGRGVGFVERVGFFGDLSGTLAGNGCALVPGSLCGCCQDLRENQHHVIPSSAPRKSLAQLGGWAL